MDSKTLNSKYLQVKRVDPSARVPSRTDPGSAGYDLYTLKSTTIPARGQAIVSIGIAITVPENCYGRIAPRSGLAAKYSLDVGAGVIDRSYTGEIRIIMFNHSDNDYTIDKHDRAAQLIIERCETPMIVCVDTLKPTIRGNGGFGSSGR